MLGYLANILNLLIQTPDKVSVIKDCFCLSSSSYYSGFMQYWLRVRDWVAVKLDQKVCWKWNFCQKTNNICISLKLTMINSGTTTRSISTGGPNLSIICKGIFSTKGENILTHQHRDSSIFSQSSFTTRALRTFEKPLKNIEASVYKCIEKLCVMKKRPFQFTSNPFSIDFWWSPLNISPTLHPIEYLTRI